MKRTIVTIGALGDDVAGPGMSTRHLRAAGMDELFSIGAADADAHALGDDFSSYDVPISTGVAIQQPGPKGTSSASSSGAKAAGWAKGNGTYVLQSGDTLSGLAKIYLGSAGRYPEIWALQSATYKASRTADRVNAGDVLAMSAEAIARAKALGVYPAEKTNVPAAPPGVVEAPVAIAPKATHHLLLGSLGAAASAGLGLLLWSDDRKKKKRAPARGRRRGR
jgi:hypothetical protein